MEKWIEVVTAAIQAESITKQNAYGQIRTTFVTK